ncbi:hypothetical protein [Dickeya dadantii]|uniref:hypothetical protein n=1 Tax=Dickeya dadantii TaxID=204038 RepID=UPI0003A3247E|nr:hypothetical protein [Dickeya dadantii]MCA7011103.1 hypothetical protein [Dickeya dadantii]QWT41877.1 hypothetical protein KNV89_05065 [Dickeya dadantii]UAY95578.1 hypothetical protein KTF62_17525 [Dickeya dadantii]
MKTKIAAIALLLLTTGASGVAAASEYPCRSPEWNVWVEMQVNTRGLLGDVEVGSLVWQQAVESRLPAASWPSRNSVLWCAAVEQKLASLKK